MQTELDTEVDAMQTELDSIGIGNAGLQRTTTVGLALPTAVTGAAAMGPSNRPPATCTEVGAVSDGMYTLALGSAPARTGLPQRSSVT